MDCKKPAVIFLLLFLFPSPLEAHGLFTFAWVEGDRICTDSYFSRQSKARGARISMVGPEGRILASGLTDDRGGFCFDRPPAPQNLTFVVEAEGGHRGEFALPADDLPADDLPAGDLPADVPAETGPAPDRADSLAALRRLVREEVRAELAAQLGPLNRKLAAGEARTEPGPREIAGGLGWLAGLAGLAFWWTARRRGRLK